MRNLEQGALLAQGLARARLAEAQATRASVFQRVDAPADPDSLHTYMREIWGFHIPREQACPGHAAPFDAFCAAFFAADPIIVWHASRGLGGKTCLLAALGCAEAASLRAGVTILGGSGEQSRRVHAYMEGSDTNLPHAYWNAPGAPRELLKSKLSAWRTSLRHGGWIHALAASQTSVRGPHPQRLRLDEVDEMDLKIFDAALGQPMEAKGILSQTVCSSTHHNPDGTMTEILRRAAEKDWPIFEWCFKENMLGPDAWLTDLTVERKKATVSVLMWQVEFELQEPSPEGRAIQVESVEAMFDAALGNPGGGQGETHIWQVPLWELDPQWPGPLAWLEELPADEQVKVRTSRRYRMRHLTAEQQEEHAGDVKRRKEVRKRMKCRYAAGADWGKARDHTIIWVMRIDVKPRRMVAYANLVRQPYPVMFAKFNNLVARYDADAAHDATGVGTAAEDYMETGVIDFKMVGQQRTDLFNEYIVAIEAGQILGPRVIYAYREHLYVTTDDLYGSGHPPDSVVAGAMAWHASTLSRGLIR